MSTKVGVVSLGCDKNRVDTEIMLYNLQQAGYQLTASPQDAEVIIVNTCAFLESARREAIDTALEMFHFKEQGSCKKLILTGCLGQKFGKEIFDGLDEVDAVVGTNEYDRIAEIVKETLEGDRKLYNRSPECLTFGNRVLTTPSHFAYLKIADGCNNFCSYCLIPHIRGRFRSVPMQSLVQQAAQLAERGVKELILVAQDTTKYGVDLYGKGSLVPLLRQLSGIEGIRRLRLLYCYPELTDEQLIREIETNDKIAKYIDIPLQHVNDGMLKAMNRKSTAEGVRRLFDRLQRSQPKIQVRSTFICGFPGETPQTVEEVAEFLKRYKLRNVGFFPYSREEGTVAATMAQQVDGRKKNAYVRKLYGVQQSVVAELLQSDVGKTYLCIVDEPCSDGKYKGRTEFMSPEIDGCVYISSSKRLHAGDFVSVKITDKTDYDLIGEVAE